MALSFKHAFTSAKGDPGDATLIRPSNWNAEHTMTAAANVVLGAVGAGAVSEIACTAVGRAVIGAADAAAQRTALGVGSGDSPTFTNASLTGVLKASSGAVGAPAHTFTADLTTGAYFVAGHYNITVAGVKVVDVSAALVAITGALTTTTSITAGNGLAVTAGTVTFPAAATALLNPFGAALLHVQDQKAAGTGGGTFTSGAWRTRTLNTTLTNEITGASLASNQITLPAGTYYLEAVGVAGAVNRHQVKLRNATDSTDTLIGRSANSTASGVSSNSESIVSGRFTIAAQKIFELQHQCQTTQATQGLGYEANFGVVECYADVKIWKVA